MQESDCIRFLQWALPQLNMRWAGFRKVHKQVCKRLARRLSELDIAGVEAYQHYLYQKPEEWRNLDALCRVVVTRFYRDKQVFAELTATLLPQLVSRTVANGRTQLRAWSIGSASGEEPYTLSILWHHWLAPQFSQIQLAILATELDPQLIARSQHACYTLASLKNLPDELRTTAFIHVDGEWCLKHQYKAVVTFEQQDIRTMLPGGSFDIIFCRNLVFTYFDEAQQNVILNRLLSRLVPQGLLVLGVHERPPVGSSGYLVLSERLGLYQQLNFTDSTHLTQRVY